ncbi:SRPBCC domain-containing protein [Sandarakinorhabdus sp. AAP62]|uniref:SRPBCC family protein n=1 Tax=Sandarakinorhabdus sp. AAP62 TaxID=1248916 RepID=UPI0003792537|nr:SRPBCC domain-containing protein [Sandarakinorhabdus sp. AAP62]
MRAIALALLLAAAPAGAAVTSSAPDGFVSRSEAVVPQPPAAMWAALVNWGAWWDPAHSYSGKPGVLTLEIKPGGLLHEQWPGGNVWHAQVVNALPPALLRLQGGFGPLQALPVNAVLDFTLKPEGSGTRLTMTYRVAGSSASKLDTLAAPVDAVMSAGFARLVNFATTGKP